MALAPRFDRSGLPSSSRRARSISRWSYASKPSSVGAITSFTFATARSPLPPYRLASPSRSSIASCSPVEAPLGTAALPNAPSTRTASTSTVGFPRESSTSRAMTASIRDMGVPILRPRTGASGDLIGSGTVGPWMSRSPSAAASTTGWTAGRTRRPGGRRPRRSRRPCSTPSRRRAWPIARSWTSAAASATSRSRSSPEAPRAGRGSTSPRRRSTRPASWRRREGSATA